MQAHAYLGEILPLQSLGWYHEVHHATIKEAKMPTVFLLYLQQREHTLVFILPSLCHGRLTEQLMTVLRFPRFFKSNTFCREHSRFTTFPVKFVCA